MTSILVVEPDATIAEELSTSLMAPNRRVDVVNSAAAAIDWTDEHGSSDFVAIDLKLPDLGPIALVAALEARIGRRLLRFYVSRDLDVGVRFSGAPVLCVPCDPSEVRAVLQEAIIERELRGTCLT